MPAQQGPFSALSTFSAMLPLTVPEDLKPLLSFGNHKHRQETVSQIWKCCDNSMAVAPHKLPLALIPVSSNSIGKTPHVRALTNLAAVLWVPMMMNLEFQMLRASEALIPTISLPEHRLFIGHASPLLKQCSICPGMQPKGSITGDFMAQTTQQSGNRGLSS